MNEKWSVQPFRDEFALYQGVIIVFIGKVESDLMNTS